MLLAIDIGNTSIHNGIFDKKVLKKVFRIPTYFGDLSGDYRVKLKPYLKNIDSVIVSSVVPEALGNVEKAVKKIINKNCIIVGRDMDCGIINLYKDPKQVGSDRIVNARAAYELHQTGCIIVDFGTAITIDIVNKKSSISVGL